MRMRGLALALSGLCLSRLAVAAPDRLAFVVSSTSTDDCREVHEFQTRLLARSESLTPAAGNEPAIQYVVSVSGTPGSYQGRLEMYDPSGRRAVRKVSGSTCAGVVDALALVAAVLSDQQQAAPQAAQTAAPTLAATHGTPIGWAYGAGVSLGTNSAAGPRWRPEVGAHLVLSWQRQSVWSPELRVGGLVRGASTASTSYGDAHFDGWAARLTLSPLRWPAVGPASVRPAAGLELGRLVAQGEARVSIPWLAPELCAQSSVELIGPLGATVEASWVMPLYRDSFYFDGPNGPETAFTVPTRGFAVRVGLVLADLP